MEVKKKAKGGIYMKKGYKSEFADKHQDQHMGDSYKECGPHGAEKRAGISMKQESSWLRQEDLLCSKSSREPITGAQGWSAWWRGICVARP